MADYYRDKRDYRDRRDDSGSSDEEARTTIRRYKVKNPSRVERVEEDDRRSSHFSSRGGRNETDFLEIDRFKERSYPERSRSTVDDRGGRITVWEDKDYDKRSGARGSRGNDDFRVERRYEESFEDRHGHEVDRYRKETEYYSQPDPPPAPVIIRQRAPEPQKIYVQGAASPAPIIVPRQEIILRDGGRDHGRDMVRRRDSYDEDYYYRHEKRNGPYGDTEITRWDRRRKGSKDYDEDDDYYVKKKTVIRRERSASSDHHKRSLAEGAIAGAGLSAILSSRRDADGDLPANRGRKVLAGAAFGALGTEVLRRAHSAYEDRWGDRDESPGHHSRLKKAFELGAVALAAAGAAKYMQTNKIEKEEASRGRSRRRSRHRSRSYSHSGESYSRSPPRSKSRRRSISKIAKAALGTAAVAGVAKHFHDKRSRSRGGGKSRSRSRLRTAAGIGGAAAAAGLAHKAWKSHKDKKERERSQSRGLSRDSAGSRFSRSRSQSQARSLHSDRGPDPELGLVEYGNEPFSPTDGHPANYSEEQRYESEADARRRRRQRARDRDRSASGSDEGTKRKSSRSRSRLRDLAASGAAAIGIKEYKDKKDAEKREKRSRERRKEEDRRRRESDRNDDYDGDHGHPSSPPNASGGAYHPPYPQTPGAGMGGGPGFPQYNAEQTYIPQDYMGYVPPAPPGPPGPGPPPMSGANGDGNQGYPPPNNQGYPPPPPPGPPPPDHVSETRSQNRARNKEEERVKRSKSYPNDSGQAHAGSKSVTFIPLSPKSARTMETHHREQSEREEEEIDEDEEIEERGGNNDGRLSRFNTQSHRRGSDPTSNRSRNIHHSSSDSESEVEDIPDRFDRHGQPLDPRDRLRHSTGGGGAMTTRSGQFERRPQHDGDWAIQGAWQVGSTDHEAVDRLVRNVTGALEGRGGWMSVLGDVLGANGRLGDVDERSEDDDNRRRRRRRRRRD